MIYYGKTLFGCGPKLTAVQLVVRASAEVFEKTDKFFNKSLKLITDCRIAEINE